MSHIDFSQEPNLIKNTVQTSHLAPTPSKQTKCPAQHLIHNTQHLLHTPAIPDVEASSKNPLAY